jgi:glutamate synthase domain-containing protein 2
MRKIFIGFAIISSIGIALLALVSAKYLLLFAITLPVIVLGFLDLKQTKHTIRRNFPVLGRMRYFMEKLRPGIHQYFVESDTNGKPFNRLQRSLVYSRSKKQTNTVPFGTQLNVYEQGYEWINHSVNPIDMHHADMNPRVIIGSTQCTQKYSSSMFNISAMSFGSLSKNAIIALNEGAKMGAFYHNTGEGGLSPYHLQGGGDVVWNIGTGYFSTRNADGTFSEVEFEKRANLPNVKMIEIKFSQGAKPGHGGILPKEKVTDEIANIRLVNKGEDIISPPFHRAFTTPLELMAFVQKLRTLSNGKPVGIKICIGQRSQFISICKAMVATNTFLDFITVDGGEGGTGAAPLEFSDHVGMPLRDAIAFVHDCLVGFALKSEIKIICSGKIISGFDIVRALSAGADVCNSARGMMFALGCIQALECNTNSCPTGVATQKKHLVDGLVIHEKNIRVAAYHKETVKSAVELMCSAGIDHPDKVDRIVMHKRVDEHVIKTYEDLYPELTIGCLLHETSIPELWHRDCSRANINKW